MRLRLFWKINELSSLTATLTPNGNSVGGGAKHYRNDENPQMPPLPPLLRNRCYTI